MRPHLYVATAIALSVLTFVSAQPSAQQADSYAGYKVAPVEIPSSTKYTHKYVEVLGSNMAYIDVGEGRI